MNFLDISLRRLSTFWSFDDEKQWVPTVWSFFLYNSLGALYPIASDDPGRLGLQLPFEPPSSLASTHPRWGSIDRFFIKDCNCHWPRPKLYLFMYKLIEVLFQKTTMFFLYQYVLTSSTRGNHPTVLRSSGFQFIKCLIALSSLVSVHSFRLQLTSCLPGFGLLPSTVGEKEEK